MAADVGKSTQGSVGGAGDQNGLSGNLAGEVIAGVGGPLGEPGGLPGAAEDWVRSAARTSGLVYQRAGSVVARDRSG